MTVIELVQRMSERLDNAGVAYGHGTTNGFDEAAWLVLWKLGLPLDALDDVAARALSDKEQEAVQALIEQRIGTRRPAAYLTGEAWLHGVPFFIDERAIVPRSLIAEPLLDGTLDVWLSAHTRRVLDLCTGNGSLAVLAALSWPDVQVLATDLSADALAVAQRNVQRHGLSERIALAQGDGLAAAPGPYDLILCNPPYVNRVSMSNLPRRIPRRTRARSGRRRRRHGLHPPPAGASPRPHERRGRAGARDRARARALRSRVSRSLGDLAAHQRR